MSQGLSVQVESLAELAQKIFAELYQAIISQEEGVWKHEVEAVHQMRVATRRLRVALSNFAVCCEPGLRRSMRALLGELARLLCGVRDFDVMVATLHEYKSCLPASEQKYLSALIRRLRARRLRRRRALEAFLLQEDYARFKREFLSALLIPSASEPRLTRPEDHG